MSQFTLNVITSVTKNLHSVNNRKLSVKMNIKTEKTISNNKEMKLGAERHFHLLFHCTLYYSQLAMIAVATRQSEIYLNSTKVQLSCLLPVFATNWHEYIFFHFSSTKLFLFLFFFLLSYNHVNFNVSLVLSKHGLHKTSRYHLLFFYLQKNEKK